MNIFENIFGIPEISGKLTSLKTGSKEPVETRFAVNLLMKKNFTESVVCRTNSFYTKKTATYIVGKQYLNPEKGVFSDDVGV